jgi:hypothetical protein
MDTRSDLGMFHLPGTKPALPGALTGHDKWELVSLPDVPHSVDRSLSVHRYKFSVQSVPLHGMQARLIARDCCLSGSQ